MGCQCFVYALTSWIDITGLTFFPQALQKKIGHDNTFNSLFFHDDLFDVLMSLQFVQTLQVPTKIDHHFHYLDIQAIESKKPNQVVFK